MIYLGYYINLYFTLANITFVFIFPVIATAATASIAGVVTLVGVVVVICRYEEMSYDFQLHGVSEQDCPYPIILNPI